MSEKRRANKAFKKGQKYSRQQTRNNVPSRYRPMSEPKGCAVALVMIVGGLLALISAVGYGAYLIIT